MKVICVGEFPAQPPREQVADGGLAGAGHAHHHDDHADSASMPAQQENDVQRNEHGDDHFQREHAPLVELRDHELVEFTRRLQLLADQRLVVIDANLRGDDFVDARIVRVADEFYGVFGALRQIHDVQAEAVQTAGAAGQSPAGKKTFVALERAVHVGQQAGKEFVVVAKLQQLRVRVFEQIDNRGGGVRLVVYKPGAPARHDQVGRVIR